MINNLFTTFSRSVVLSGALISMAEFFVSGQEVSNPVIESAFNPGKYEWEISWPGRISRYDLVYLSPPVDPMQGIPLGNGDIGVLFWCEGSKIIAAVNKSDLWDDAPFGPFHNWSPGEEDYSTTQRHACRIIIDFKYPVFNILYLKDFKARLSLADGSLSIQSLSAFGKVSLKAFVDHSSGLIFYDMGSDLNENVPVDIILERFGSRTFSHWYSQINSDASIGLSGTEAYVGDKGVLITQKLSSGTFAAGGRVISDNGLKTEYSREHSRSTKITLSGEQQKKARLVFAITSPVDTDPVAISDSLLSEADKKGTDSILISNSLKWKTIWEQSFMDYGDDYLNALWHLTMFYANASQGGKYPGRFNNGMWGWDSDVQNWNFYFHWNQQQIFWPLNAAGFHRLVDPYLDFRFRSLPEARKDAKIIFNARGAFISDVTERRGYNSGSENANHTPVAEIAMDFWRQYRYTCDKKFLEEKALPFIIEAARFFESLLEKEDDGLYHARKGTGYEGWIELKDGLTELTYARMLFETALQALKAAGSKIPEAEKWQDIVTHLALLPSIPAGDGNISGNSGSFRLNRGFNKGKPAPVDSIFAAGWGLKEKKWLTVYNPVEDTLNFGLKLLDGIFPSVPSSPVFPSGLIGLKDKGTSDFNTITSTTLLYGREITGWDPVPVVMARLGLRDELAKDLGNFPSRWQIYCNGWGHWGLEGEVNKDAGWFFRTNMVRDIAHPERDKFPLPMWPFRHMSMESMSVLVTAMNESLIQSYDGIIRLFPAFPENRSGRFTLHAEGGFIVSSEIDSGIIRWVNVKSLYGNDLNIELPWENALLYSGQLKKTMKTIGKTALIRTRAGEELLILDKGIDRKNWSVKREDYKQNEVVRFHPSGKARLGIPGMF
jgi:alpha-L-fucosidase 2